MAVGHPRLYVNEDEPVVKTHWRRAGQIDFVEMSEVQCIEAGEADKGRDLSGHGANTKATADITSRTKYFLACRIGAYEWKKLTKDVAYVLRELWQALLIQQASTQYRSKPMQTVGSL